MSIERWAPQSKQENKVQGGARGGSDIFHKAGGGKRDFMRPEGEQISPWSKEAEQCLQLNKKSIATSSAEQKGRSVLSRVGKQTYVRSGAGRSEVQGRAGWLSEAYGEALICCGVFCGVGRQSDVLRRARKQGNVLRVAKKQSNIQCWAGRLSDVWSRARKEGDGFGWTSLFLVENIVL